MKLRGSEQLHFINKLISLQLQLLIRYDIMTAFGGTIMKYPFILLDIDGTLINFDRTFSNAFAATLEFGGCEATEKNISHYHDCNDEAWYESGLDDVDDPSVCKIYHTGYRQYLLNTSKKAKARMNLNKTPSELTSHFIKAMGDFAILNTNALEVCRQLSVNHTLCIASNGLTDLQMGKLTALAPYFSHYFISEDMDCIKPETEYFCYIFNKLGCTAGECIMIGDSLKNDIDGANKSGIASCYYNPTGYINKTGITPTYEIRDFSELLNIV